MPLLLFLIQGSSLLFDWPLRLSLLSSWSLRSRFYELFWFIFKFIFTLTSRFNFRFFYSDIILLIFFCFILSGESSYFSGCRLVCDFFLMNDCTSTSELLMSGICIYLQFMDPPSSFNPFLNELFFKSLDFSGTVRSSSSLMDSREALDQFLVGRFLRCTSNRFCQSLVNQLSCRLRLIKYGCLSASSTVMRSAWFMRRQAFMKLSAFFYILPRYLISNVSILLTYGIYIPSNLIFQLKWFRCWAVRLPTSLVMMYIWSIQSSPGNMGWPSTSQPMMQPTAQRSAGLPQVQPTSSQGLRYQRVATQSVRSYSLSGRKRANPKSQIFRREQSALSRMFQGLTSRWMMFLEWRY